MSEAKLVDTHIILLTMDTRVAFSLDKSHTLLAGGGGPLSYVAHNISIYATGDEKATQM